MPTILCKSVLHHDSRWQDKADSECFKEHLNCLPVYLHPTQLLYVSILTLETKTKAMMKVVPMKSPELKTAAYVLLRSFSV